MDIKNGNPKYKSILITAKDLFWKFGIKRVSVEEICREAKVSKMTYYRFFPNKNELAKKILQDVFDEALANYRTMMARDVPFAEKARETILMKFEGTKEISQELVLDIYKNNDKDLLAFIENFRKETINELIGDYIKAQEKGEIRQDIKPAFILYNINKMMEMISDQQLIDQYDSIQDLIMEMINYFFYGLGVKD